MEKILKKYTTIPEHLYVNRSADVQLKKIIEEMQRPGYVLVARQMGKTNLLINAKRTLQSSSRFFTYIDMSNLYDSEKECYRNIIDNLLDLNFDDSKIDQEIKALRTKNFPPHNEYSKSLRIILKYFKGDLVIILDEIDALKSVEYSDHIFAQIRSNYFSRTNYPEFERLTYVLSGVIEPTELIKDRNKSPFNIGDKIYLDDFTNEEHCVFIKKSKLNVDSNLSDEIFSWTNGNPRLTFDICSELEDILLNGDAISVNKIATLIREKYLTTFDIAPVDHIRELVKTNSQIREAITLIHKQRTLELDDEIKRKLYLFGIINSAFNENIKIKNKIIETCLSEEWIKSIERGKQISLVFGLARYDSKDYLGAIDIFNEVIYFKATTKNDLEAARYFTGLSYFKLKNYPKAIEYFQGDFVVKDYISDSKAFFGICMIAMGEEEKGIEILQESIKTETNNYAYHNAILNLAIHTEDENVAFDLYKTLYDSTFKSKNDTKEDLNQLRTLSTYYQAEIAIRKEQFDEALELLDLSIQYAEPSEVLYLKFYKHISGLQEDPEIGKEIVESIITQNLVLDEDDSNPIRFDQPLLLNYLAFVFDEFDLTLFEKLLEYAVVQLKTRTSRAELIFSVSRISQNKKRNILKFLIGQVENEPMLPSTLAKIYKELALTYIAAKNNKFLLEYFYKYSSYLKDIDKIEKNDIYLFALAIKANSEANRSVEALKLCKIIEERRLDIENESIEVEFIIIYYWFANIYAFLRDNPNTIKYADLTLDLILKSSNSRTSMIDEKGLATIKEQVLAFKDRAIKRVPLVSQKTYNRNDKIRVRYLDGSVLEKKFKYLEEDLMNKKCEIV